MNPLALLSRYVGFPCPPRAQKAPANAGRKMRRRKPGLETLEDRTVPTAVAAISVEDGTAVENATDIAPYGTFASTAGDAYASLLGPDGALYVSTNSGSAVYRYDAETGSPRPAPGKAGAEFVSPGDGGLTLGRDIAFGPDGYLYVVSEGTDAVLRYDPATGAPAGLSGQTGDAAFVAGGSGSLDAPRGLAFRDGYVYVTSVGGTAPAPGMDSVLRYDAATGAPAGLSGQPGDAVFIASGSGGLDNPSRIVFGPDGRAYVSSTATTVSSATANSVLRYDGVTGVSAGISGQAGDAVFVSPGSGGLNGPVAMVFRPDGYLYVTSWRSNSVLRYQASTGAFVSTVVPSQSGGLSSPIDLLFEPDGTLLVTSKGTNEVLHFGPQSIAAFAVRLSIPSTTPVTVNYATASGTATGAADFTPVSGTLTFAPGQTVQTILVPTLPDTAAEGTETFTVNLSNATGGSITRGQATGTIIDDDATKFFVGDDGSTDRTYRYGVPGNALATSALAAGNTAPRGVAANAAGTTVWVADANNTVYVYGATGNLLGSWTASGLPRNASVEGITTNGTDLWIVANSTNKDKVFKYAGAASRRSGSQSVASSFGLASGDTMPKDIVTDGSSFWIVDANRNVYKYTLTGGLLGSWTLDAANTKPTGITLNPNAVNDLWIVDNSTLKVYQYTAAAGRTSGSQNASASFALNPFDTNPQGIADPPAGTTATHRPAPRKPAVHIPVKARDHVLAHGVDPLNGVGRRLGFAR